MFCNVCGRYTHKYHRYKKYRLRILNQLLYSKEKKAFIIITFFNVRCVILCIVYI